MLLHNVSQILNVHMATSQYISFLNKYSVIVINLLLHYERKQGP